MEHFKVRVTARTKKQIVLSFQSNEVAILHSSNSNFAYFENLQVGETYNLTLEKVSLSCDLYEAFKIGAIQTGFKPFNIVRYLEWVNWHEENPNATDQEKFQKYANLVPDDEGSEYFSFTKAD